MATYLEELTQRTHYELQRSDNGGKKWRLIGLFTDGSYFDLINREHNHERCYPLLPRNEDGWDVRIIMRSSTSMFKDPIEYVRFRIRIHDGIPADVTPLEDEAVQT